MAQYIIYLRKGKSHNPAAQLAAAQQFVRANGGRIIGSFTEESVAGRWPALERAIDLAVKKGATLVIAKLDRLVRNVVFTTTLLKTGVEFVCCDMPNANHTTIHVLAALADEESQRVRQRARDSLVAAKARGVKLGSHREGHWDGREHKRGWKQAVAGSIAARKRRAAEAYQFVLPEIKARRERGETLPQIIDWLHANGHTTTAGKPFTQTALWRIIKRYLGAEYLGNNTRKFAKVGG